MIKLIFSCLPSPAAPNPPTVTVTPLYNSSGDLLEIKTQAADGVGCDSCLICLKFLHTSFNFSVHNVVSFECIQLGRCKCCRHFEHYY